MYIIPSNLKADIRTEQTLWIPTLQQQWLDHFKNDRAQYYLMIPLSSFIYSFLLPKFKWQWFNFLSFTSPTALEGCLQTTAYLKWENNLSEDRLFIINGLLIGLP